MAFPLRHVGLDPTESIPFIPGIRAVIAALDDSNDYYYDYDFISFSVIAHLINIILP